MRLRSQRPDSTSPLHAGVCGSGVRDAALDFVHPQLSAGRVRGTEVVDSLAGFQLEWKEDEDGRRRLGRDKRTFCFWLLKLRSVLLILANRPFCSFTNRPPDGPDKGFYLFRGRFPATPLPLQMNLTVTEAEPGWFGTTRADSIFKTNHSII